MLSRYRHSCWWPVRVRGTRTVVLLIFTCASARCRKGPLTNCFGESAGRSRGRCRDHIPRNWSREPRCGNARHPPALRRRPTHPRAAASNTEHPQALGMILMIHRYLFTASIKLMHNPCPTIRSGKHVNWAGEQIERKDHQRQSASDKLSRPRWFGARGAAGLGAGGVRFGPYVTLCYRMHYSASGESDDLLQYTAAEGIVCTPRRRRPPRVGGASRACSGAQLTAFPTIVLRGGASDGGEASLTAQVAQPDRIAQINAIKADGIFRDRCWRRARRHRHRRLLVQFNYSVVKADRSRRPMVGEQRATGGARSAATGRTGAPRAGSARRQRAAVAGPAAPDAVAPHRHIAAEPHATFKFRNRRLSRVQLACIHGGDPASGILLQHAHCAGSHRRLPRPRAASRSRLLPAPATMARGVSRFCLL
ncbi:hypothetical protein EVAR_73720_1 [Eumeta japonica]|uniref:Uncharacterized protein n=1 Tax=Eumeta variegata TaxID=151549 RepID=A0A4C1SLA9_EUMVA|nr:hypothetical protein EVAR_73720_1 [Eumeta japonica]